MEEGAREQGVWWVREIDSTYQLPSTSPEHNRNAGRGRRTGTRALARSTGCSRPRRRPCWAQRRVMSRRRRGRRGTCPGSCSRAIAIQAALEASESRRREDLRSRVSVFCSVLQLVKKGGTVPLRRTKLSGWSCQSSKPASVARTKCEWLMWMWLCCGRGRVEIDVRARCIGSERVGQGGGRERECWARTRARGRARLARSSPNTRFSSASKTLASAQLSLSLVAS